MRYYTVIIFKPDNITPDKTYTSFVRGFTDPNALDIEIDISVAPYNEPSAGGSMVRIYGVPLQDLAQSANLNGRAIQVYGGMQKGLPLANPKQAGLLVTGITTQVFGNWIGTEQTLDIYMVAGNIEAANSPVLSFNWGAGTSLQSAISQTLNVAFPAYQQEFAISPNLVLANNESGFYGSFIQFARYLNEISVKIIGGKSYAGVNLLLKQNKFVVYDRSTQTSPIQIEATDLVGQPTWLDPGTIQITAVMRADISTESYVKMPQTLFQTTAQSMSQFRNKSVFQGVFGVRNVRHVGRFRNPPGTSWITLIDCVVLLNG